MRVHIVTAIMAAIAHAECHYMDTDCEEQKEMDAAMDDATTCHYMDTDCLNQESSSQYDQYECNGAYTAAVDAGVYCMNMVDSYDCYDENGSDAVATAVEELMDMYCGPDLTTEYISN